MEYLKAAGDVIAALGALSTVIAHIPGLPAKYAEFFARFGLTTQSFSVNKRQL